MGENRLTWQDLKNEVEAKGIIMKNVKRRIAKSYTFNIKKKVIRNIRN
jgi:hypothetical protein